MLNKKALLGAVATVIVACSALFFMKAGGKQAALFAENVEALSDSEDPEPQLTDSVWEVEKTETQMFCTPFGSDKCVF